MKVNSDFTVSLEDLEKVQDVIGVRFENTEILIESLLHSSFFSGDKIKLDAFKSRNNLKADNYEKLEFLGDSVLDLIVNEYSYNNSKIEEYANAQRITKECVLTNIKKVLVSNEQLKLVAHDLNLHEYILCSGLENIDDMSANVIEALIGALFCDNGYFEAKEFVYDFFDLEGALGKIATSDPKTKLKEFLEQAEYKWAHFYDLIDESGPDNDKWFTVELYIENIAVSIGSGSQIKMAEADAAVKCLRTLPEVVAKING